MTLVNAEEHKCSTIFTVAYVYGSNKVNIPEGYRIVGFAIPKPGDTYLLADSGQMALANMGFEHYKAPRLILKKQNPMPPAYRYETTISIADVYEDRQPIAPGGWEISEFRVPLAGDKVITPSGWTQTIECSSYSIKEPRLILKRCAP